jgi:hypothetical protein
MVAAGGGDRLLSLLFSCQKMSRGKATPWRLTKSAADVCSTVAAHARDCSSSSSSSSSGRSLQPQSPLLLLLLAAPWLVLLARYVASHAQHMVNLHSQLISIAKAGLPSQAAASSRKAACAKLHCYLTCYNEAAKGLESDVEMLQEALEVCKANLAAISSSHSPAASSAAAAATAAAAAATAGG